ncbi:hypothetical protein [Aeromicrobium alkaliterrae]|uniref:Uncharacterized protein n=1 Tax=Aeromicrobium alkaliterrae TaxID=302168 RepID=A0ABN2JMU2_9ACTN
MDDTAYDVDQSALAAASRRFPAHRPAPERTLTSPGLAYLATPTAFGEHAWDESGH